MPDGPTPQSFGSVDIPDDAFDGPVETPEATEAPAVTSADLALDHASDEPADTPEVEEPSAETADVFPRDYVEKIRSESANYRTKAKPYVEAFDGIEEADRDVFLGLANLYKTDPIAAGREMARLAQGLTDGAPDDAPAETPAPAGETLTPYMTETRYAEIKRQEAVETAAAQIERDAKSLGYDRGTPEYAYLLSAAQAKNGDLNAAHAYIQGREQEAVSRFVAAKTADAAGSPTAPADVSVPASGERSMKTWRDVEAAIDEMF